MSSAGRGWPRCTKGEKAVNSYVSKPEMTITSLRGYFQGIQ